MIKGSCRNRDCRCTVSLLLEWRWPRDSLNTEGEVQTVASIMIKDGYVWRRRGTYWRLLGSDHGKTTEAVTCGTRDEADGI